MPVSASDGVLEISQACAAEGCFPGDAPGFPVEIDGSVGGAFRLTSDLVVQGDAIRIVTDRPVDLDLAGFAIRGPGSCQGTPGSISCTGLAGLGIEVSAPVRNLQGRIRNGSLSGLNQGIRVPGGSGSLRLSDLRIESVGNGISGVLGSSTDLLVEHSSIRTATAACVSWRSTIEVRESEFVDCGGVGVSAPGFKIVISRSRIERTALSGIRGGDFSAIRDVEVTRASGIGVECGRGCQIVGSRISNGGSSGITAGFIASIVDNVVDFNQGLAISASDGSTIRGNSVGSATDLAAHGGIACGAGCNVVENTVRNSSQPLSLGPLSSYRRNVLSLYSGAPVVGSGVSGGDNLCEGTSC